MRMTAALDQNDRLRAGTLPANPGDDATPIPIESQARQTAARLATAAGTPPDAPCDLTAETALLAVLLWSGTYAPDTKNSNVVGDILDRSEVLYSRGHRAIWDAMAVLRERQVPCDITAVHSELVRQQRERDAGGMDYLEQLVASASPASDLKLREYAEAIREAWLRRNLIAVAASLSAAARSSKSLASLIADEHAHQLVATAGVGTRDATFVPVAVPLERTMEKAQKPRVDDALTTGFEKIDHLLLGGLRRKQMTVLAARTSVGKSALALDIAISAHEANVNAAVLYITLEMSEEEFTDRMVASRARVELRNILKGQATPDEFDRMVEVARRIAVEEIYFNVKHSLTTMQISSIATKLSQKLARKGKRLGLIVVDHIGLVKPMTRTASRQQDVATVSRELLTMASHHDCHVLALAQINREAEKQNGKDKIPLLHHLKDSGSIEEDTNNVLLLHRERDAKTGRFVEGKPARLSVAKARNGELGLVWLAFEPKHARFSPWETSEQSRARAPDPNRNPSRQYLDPNREPPTGRSPDHDGEEDPNPLSASW
jgi:replicative DNA helicase